MPGNRGGGRGAMPRGVQVSKKLSWLLRHGAEKEGLTLNSSGYANMADVLANRNLRSLKVTFEEVRQIVAENDKQRFSLIPAAPSPSSSSLSSDEAAATSNGIAEEVEKGGKDQPSTNAKDYLIRANQGHSLKLDSEGAGDLLVPITAQSSDIPPTAVHGTTHANWIRILASVGLKPMGRNHVHFASGLPAGFASLIPSTEAAEAPAALPVISGMRNSSTVLIYLDLPRALGAGIEFGRSENGVILTSGDERGLVPVEFFRWVEDRMGEGVLVADGKVVKDAPASWGKGKGKG